MLLVVTTLVCLTAATLNEPPEEEHVLRGAIALLRAALCVTFSAALTLGAMRADGYLKSFYIGGAAVAALPLLVLVETVGGSLNQPWSVQGIRWLPSHLAAGLTETAAYRWWFARLWGLVPGIGLAAVGFDWNFRLSVVAQDLHAKLTPRRFALRGTLFVVLVIGLAAMSAIPTDTRKTRLVIPQIWLAESLCLFFAAALAVGAVRAAGYFKTFCIGGLLPALLAVVWLFVTVTIFSVHRDDTLTLLRWQSSFDSNDQTRFLLVGHWAMIPVLGTAFVACDWVWRRGRLNSKSE